MTLGWITSIAGLFVLMSFINTKRSAMTCKEVKVLIPGTSSFIDRKEINRIVLEGAGDIKGAPLYKINLHKIENTLKSNSYIRKARVYADMDGVVHIEIEQRDPVLRIYNAANQDYYVDRDGYKIPVSPSYTPHVLVANGSIFEGFNGRIDTLKSSVAKDLYQIAIAFEKDSLWNEQIEQLYVNGQKDIELVPRVGEQRIILGTADSLDVRMNNLRIFYKEVMPSVGWDFYKTINIKYTNQIVCVKSSADSINPVMITNKMIEHKEISKTAKKVKP